MNGRERCRTHEIIRTRQSVLTIYEVGPKHLARRSHGGDIYISEAWFKVRFWTKLVWEPSTALPVRDDALGELSRGQSAKVTQEGLVDGRELLTCPLRHLGFDLGDLPAQLPDLVLLVEDLLLNRTRTHCVDRAGKR